MTGREKCQFLRLIRKQIAEANNIEFKTTECSYDGPCAGTCPKCDVEIRYLETQLKAKSANREGISIEGLALESYNEAVSCAHIWKGTNIYTQEDRDSPDVGCILPHYSRLSGHWDAKLDSPIEMLDLDSSTATALRNAEISTVHHLTQITKYDLRQLNIITDQAVSEIEHKLRSLGYFFLEEVDITAGIFPLHQKNDGSKP